uniref:Trinucleotide repeat containing 18 n=1 Tax=Mesocestoides corti TaxID=53468 RepID=A0A5K3G2H3_MESCO
TSQLPFYWQSLASSGPSSASSSILDFWSSTASPSLTNCHQVSNGAPPSVCGNLSPPSAHANSSPSPPRRGDPRHPENSCGESMRTGWPTNHVP